MVGNRRILKQKEQIRKGRVKLLRRRLVGRSLEICFLWHLSTLNYTNLQMAFNEEWNGKRSSFCTGILAVIPDPMHTRISTTILPTFCIFIFGKMELEAPYFWSLPQTPKFLGLWVLRFRSRVLRSRVLGASFSRFRGLRFRSRVLRFWDLGASFSRFGCFVLRSSFSKLRNVKVSSRIKNHHFSKFAIFRWLNRAHQELSFKNNSRKKCFFCADLWSAKVFSMLIFLIIGSLTSPVILNTHAAVEPS